MPSSEVVAGYFISAAIGATITYLAQNYVRLLTEDVAQLNDHIAEISRVQDAAVAYWLSVHEHETAEEKDLRYRLLGALEVSKSFRPDASRLLGCRFGRYKELDGLIYDLATGGCFETASREQDGNRAVEVMALCHDLRAVLRSARRAVFWAH